jgi:ubiquinone/menaquinone biosynthesis C-methylase UbiE
MGRVGFESGSDGYERSRPGYPDQAVSALFAQSGLQPGSRVLDLAAGTGKLTRQLVAKGAVCVGVEPSPSMRQVFRRAVPGVPVMAGVGEAIPVRSGAVEAVVVAQAFHWFDPPPALADIARVLRPGGTLSLIWNERDESDPMMAELVAISQWDRYQPYPVGRDFGALIDASGRFGPVTRTKFSFRQTVDRATLVEQVASRSYVAILPEAERAAFLETVADFAATLPEPIPLPYVTDLFTASVAS